MNEDKLKMRMYTGVRRRLVTPVDVPDEREIGTFDDVEVEKPEMEPDAEETQPRRNAKRGRRFESRYVEMASSDLIERLDMLLVQLQD